MLHQTMPPPQSASRVSIPVRTPAGIRRSTRRSLHLQPSAVPPTIPVYKCALLLITTAVVMVTGQAAALDQCPTGWIRMEGTCLKFFSLGLNWTDAKAHCSSAGAYLGEVRRGTNALVASLTTGPTWIGYRQDKVTKIYHRDLGRDRQADSSETRDEGCVYYSVLFNLLRWETRDCNSTANHVCEKATVSCPLGWAEYGGKCFRMYSELSTWAEAAAGCRREGGHLAEAHDSTEDTALYRLTFDTLGPWLGLVATTTTGRYRWVTSNITVATSEIPWGRGEPTVSNSDCIAYSSFAFTKWEDLDCLDRRPYNCQRAIDECGEGLQNCLAPNLTCVNTLGSFECQCSPGFSSPTSNPLFCEVIPDVSPTVLPTNATAVGNTTEINEDSEGSTASVPVGLIVACVLGGVVCLAFLVYTALIYYQVIKIKGGPLGQCSARVSP